MDKEGQWSLAPAFDVAYSYNASGTWTATHQMTLNGKRDAFDIDDVRAVARSATMKRGRADAILEQVRSAVARWPEFAADARVAGDVRDRIQRTHRLELSVP